jgi:hypothetical protein
MARSNGNPIHIKILPDEDGMHYCGWFPGGGYSSVGAVRSRTLEQAIAFYFKILHSKWLFLRC